MNGPMINIDFTQMADPPERGAIPSDWYTVTITSGEVKENSAKNGGYLELKFQVQEGPYRGMVLRNNFNLWNPNETAVRIAHEDLKRISKATGVLALNSPDAREFAGAVLRVKVEVEQGGEKPGGAPGERYPDQNRITQYKAVNDPTAVSAPQQPASPAAAQGQPSAGAWGAAPAPAAAPAAAAAPPQLGAQQWQQPAAAPAAAPAAPQQPVQPQAQQWGAPAAAAPPAAAPAAPAAGGWGAPAASPAAPAVPAGAPAWSR